MLLETESTLPIQTSLLLKKSFKIKRHLFGTPLASKKEGVPAAASRIEPLFPEGEEGWRARIPVA